ncbi:MAG TPA: toll/interleukin-1 receptor domain-containing protein [Ktedonobacteraceae bacterium]|nr:toll/interleukin-1 receptor domain-containing protein [Ktedonobacteraceae bacterium]
MQDGGPGIFVSYYAANRMHPDYLFATQCMRDLKARGAEIVAESSRIPPTLPDPYLYEQVSRCQWMLMILTPDALQSRQVQREVEVALKLATQQRLRGMLAVLPAPLPLEALPPAWSAARVFDASEDYARALAAIALVLNLVRLQAPPPAVLPKETRQPLTVLLRERRRKSSAIRTFPALSALTGKSGLVAALALALIFLLIFSGMVIARGQTGATHAVTPTPTVLPTDPVQLFSYITRRSPTLADSLSKQDMYRWDDTGGCAFQNGSYDVSISTQNSYTNCLEHFTSFSNFAYQVQMQIISGDAGGMLFRANNSLSDFYRFSLDIAQQHYNLLVVKAAGQSRPISNPSPLPVQLHQTYTLTVIAIKDLLYLYANGQSLVIKSDASFQSGEIGMYAYALSDPTEVEFSDMKVWAI